VGSEEDFRISILDFRFWFQNTGIFASDRRCTILGIEVKIPQLTEAEMKQRTQQFAFCILKLAQALPNTRSGHAIANQIARSGTSVGANYRALWRSKSRADFSNKTSIVEEEADETAFWLEMIRDLFPFKINSAIVQDGSVHFRTYQGQQPVDV